MPHQRYTFSSLSFLSFIFTFWLLLNIPSFSLSAIYVFSSCYHYMTSFTGATVWHGNIYLFFVKTMDQCNFFIPTLIEDHVIKIYTVKPPCATTFHKRPLIQNTKTFPVKALQLELLVTGHLLQVTVTTFWAWKFNDFPLFLTSCKRPLDAFSDLYVRYVHYATWNIPHVRRT